MEFADVVRRRRMTRTFAPTPVPGDVLDRVLAAGLRAPSAGNSQGFSLVVLEGPEQTARYWDASLPPERRDGFAFPGLLDAPVLVVPVAEPAVVLARYAEADKAARVPPRRTGRDGWPVPYWLVDAAFGALLVQLAAVDEGLGVAFFGLFEQLDAVRLALRIPPEAEPVGVLAIGYPRAGPTGRSARRPDRSRAERIRRGGW